MASITVDGRSIACEDGVTLLAAMWNAGIVVTRASLGGEARGPLCAMGVCYECRVTIDGRPHQRACMVAARDGMRVSTRG